MLIDFFLEKLRIRALQLFTKSFGEKLAVSYLSEVLAFKDEESFKEFIKESSKKKLNFSCFNCGLLDGTISEDGKNLMNKESFKKYADHPWLYRKIITHVS